MKIEMPALDESILLMVTFVLVTITTIIMEWIDRKTNARMQDRVGPPILQAYYDAVKLLAKESILPDGVDRRTMTIIPIVALSAALFGALFVPVLILDGALIKSLGSFRYDLLLVLVIAMVFGVCVFLIGWASKSPYTEVGGMRALMQLLAVEIPLVLVLVIPAIITESYDISVIQLTFYETVMSDSYLYLIPIIIAIFIAIVAIAAESEAEPFDAPAAKAEIVEGWASDITGWRYAVMHIAMRVNQFFMIGIVVTLFMGGGRYGGFFEIETDEWYMETALILIYIVVLLIKIFFIIWIIALFRTIVCRFRIDQTLELFWKWLAPIAIMCVLSVLLIKGYVV